MIIEISENTLNKLRSNEINFQDGEVKLLITNKYNLDKFCIEILELLKNYATIRHLEIINYIKSQGILNIKFIDSLAKILPNMSITTLGLDSTYIGDNGIRVLTILLKDTKIKKLNLKNNYIQDGGAKYLAVALKDTAITTLDLTRNKIGSEGAKALAKAIVDNYHIVDILGITFSPEDKSIVKEACIRNKAIADNMHQVVEIYKKYSDPVAEIDLQAQHDLSEAALCFSKVVQFIPAERLNKYINLLELGISIDQFLAWQRSLVTVLSKAKELAHTNNNDSAKGKLVLDDVVESEQSKQDAEEAMSDIKTLGSSYHSNNDFE